jgi:t-SNARE complex subunit (syntaxin)
MAGAHSMLEALMTKENAVGFEVNLDTTRQTLMRLFNDMNVEVTDGEVNVDRINKAEIDL